MGNEVIVQDPPIVRAVGVPELKFTQEQVELIKRTIARDATNDELALFLYQAKKTGLDPLARQIHFVKRGGKVAIQTAIDGYRLVADRTGKYAGNDDPVFDDEEKPRKASVTVYKIVDGVRCAFTATARWDQYFPGEKQGFMWNKMPHLMLGKCAEALALRKAFPAELSGIYTNEEMEQAGPTARSYESPTPKAVLDQPEDHDAPIPLEPVIDGQTLRFVPADVRVKSGASKKGPWKKFGIKDPSGSWFGTFDPDIGHAAEDAKAKGLEVQVTWKQDGKFKTVTHIELTGDVPGDGQE